MHKRRKLVSENKARQKDHEKEATDTLKVTIPEVSSNKLNHL